MFVKIINRIDVNRFKKRFFEQCFDNLSKNTYVFAKLKMINDLTKNMFRFKIVNYFDTINENYVDLNFV